MEQLIEFGTNHWELVLTLIAAMLLLAFTENRKGGEAVSIHDATRMINKEEALVLDIRPKKDFKTGHILDSLNIPYTDLDGRMSELDAYKDKPVIVVCNLGQTATAITKKLAKANFTKVVKLKGGITEWKAEKLPVVKK